MPFVTRDLLRKRAEHNEGMISTLEELSLHQEELEGGMELFSALCPRVKILYLQNNLFSEIVGLNRMRDLGYLNMALNCLTKISGLELLESLYKLDLTVNFIDVDELKSSMEHLQGCERLSELFMMGNPCQGDFPGFVNYVIAMLPQLQHLDGVEITRSMRIVANQELPRLQRELEVLATAKRAEAAAAEARKAAEADVIEVGRAGEVIELSGNESVVVGDVDDLDEGVAEAKSGAPGDDESSPYTPASRREMYLELAEQKAEKARRDKEMQPQERDYAAEHAEAVAKTREAENEGAAPRQRNEGGWDFRIWEEEGAVKLEVELPRFLDSSLLDLDVQPHMVSLVIKGKVLRLNLPAEVQPDRGTAKRSKTTGALLVTMPVVDSRKNVVSVRAQRRAEEQAKREEEEAKQREREGRARRGPKKLQDELLVAAGDVANIVRHAEDEPAKPLLTEVSSVRADSLPEPPSEVSGAGKENAAFDDNPEVPPLE